MVDIVLTKFKVREIDDKNTEYIVLVEDVIRLITPHDYRTDTVKDNRIGKEGTFHIITHQEYGGLAARSRVIKADKEGCVHIIFNKSIHKLNVETMVKTDIQLRGVIDQLRYVLVVNGNFMEDPVKLHDRVVEHIKTKISNNVEFG